MKIIAAEWRMVPDTLGFLVSGRTDRSVIRKFKWGRLVQLKNRVYVLFANSKLRDVVKWIHEFHYRHRIPFWMNDLWLFRIVQKRGLNDSEFALYGLEKDSYGWRISK